MGATDWIEIGRMDDLARLDTPMHRLDARAKIIVTLAFIGVVMSFPPHALSALTPFLFFPLVLIYGARIPMGPIVKKILLAMPFALAVGIFNPFLDRRPVLAIGPVTITGGWMSFTSILVRFLLTAGAALALVACTGMVRLASALGQLGVPRVFVVQLLFLHRYLFVVAQEGRNVLRSVTLRSSGTRSLNLGVYGSLTGNLLLRSMDRATRVYRAMMARGFDGEIRLVHPHQVRWIDGAFIAGWLAFFALGRTWNLAGGLGHWLTGVIP
ncbi:MAG: cobalt ECF transporter T component CbiQ [Lentisphaerae bacterium RIFOXYC12_FULL_60_16]|nr:MAG: cobalt ECF transporter T component CbiQ [Lentisphaerae bacterium RIFOXYC12_FULL_60_16]OGV85423.1 MAG: cobalt ECF transporter T component CbiQ [Lentisphaerae bacterium RIFOXYB12_FULL_60_10]